MKKIFLFCSIFLCLIGIKANANNILLIGANNHYIEYSEQTAPITHRGEYYVPYTSFLVGDLGVQAITKDNNLILYTTSNLMHIDKVDGKLLGTHQTSYEYVGTQKNSQYYVSLPAVCNMLGLDYTYITGTYDVLRITNGKQTMSNAIFSDYVTVRYDSSNPKTDDQTLPNEPSEESPQKEDNTQEITLTTVYPVFFDSITKSNCETFKNSGTYFVTQASFESKELLRYAYINDLTIGIYVDFEDTYENTLKYINTVNSMLFETLGIKTELISFKTAHASEPSFLALGYQTLSVTHSSLSTSHLSTITSSVLKLSTNSQVSTLKKLVSDYDIKLEKYELY